MKRVSWILVAVLMTGCYSARRAKSQFSRAAVAYPLLPAEYCARTYPVVAKTDSTGYKASIRAIDSIAATIKADSTRSNVERDKLLAEIQRIREGIPAPESCDSLYDALYMLIAQQTATNGRLQRTNDKLIYEINHLQPIHDTVVNAAALDACNIALRQSVLNEGTERSLAAKYKARAKKYWWIIFVIGFVGISLIANKVYKSFKPKV